MSPFKALMGYDPQITDIPTYHGNNQMLFERLSEIAKIQELHASSLIAAEVMQKRTEKKGIKFQKGDRVWLEGKDLQTTHPTVKLALK